VDKLCIAKKFVMAGYSENPLIKKLGIKETSRLFLIDTPDDYFGMLGISPAKRVTKKIEEADIFHIFAVHKMDLAKHFNQVMATAKNDAAIWISWYKKSAKIPTDVTEDVIREVVLPTGWVDVKVCAVNDVWSGLKIVKRLIHR
jgi:hypothetical protein